MSNVTETALGSIPKDANPQAVKLAREFLGGHVSLEQAAWSINTQKSRKSASLVAQEIIGHRSPYSLEEIKQLVTKMVMLRYSFTWIKSVKAAAVRESLAVDVADLSLIMKGARAMLRLLGVSTSKAYAVPPEAVEKLVRMQPSRSVSLIVVVCYMMFRVSTIRVFAPSHLQRGVKGWSVEVREEKGRFHSAEWRVVNNIKPPPSVNRHFELLYTQRTVNDRPFVQELFKSESVSNEKIVGLMSEVFAQVIPNLPRLRTHTGRRTGAQWHLVVHKWNYRPIMYVGGWETLSALKEYLSDFVGLTEHLDAELGDL